jgi:hypothetical protein
LKVLYDYLKHPSDRAEFISENSSGPLFPEPPVDKDDEGVEVSP